MKSFPYRDVTELVVHRWLKRPHVLHAGFTVGASAAEADVTVVLLHGLGRTSNLWRTIAPAVAVEHPTARVIAVDLLGFGQSPKPEWQTYNATNQARSLHQTLRKKKVRGEVIIVGHSLGALVATEYARLWPQKIRRAILISAPIYKDVPDKLFDIIPRRITGEKFYKGVLRSLRERQALALRLNHYGRTLKIFAPDFVVDDQNLIGTLRSVEMAIENQSSYEHIAALTVPTLLIYGRLDPFIIKKYYRVLPRGNTNVQVASVLAGHEIATSKRFKAEIVRRITESLPDS